MPPPPSSSTQETKSQKKKGSPLTKINAKGLLPTNRHGLVSSSLALLLKLPPNVSRPLAFSMIPLSIMVITGATSAPADPAASASAPIRRPSLCVFHRPAAGSSARAVFAVSVGGRGTGGVGVGRRGRAADGEGSVMIAVRRGGGWVL